MGYRGYDHLHREPLYPFGYGLSYTSFAFSGLTVHSSAPGEATATFTVKNTGTMPGATVAQVYVSAAAGEAAKVDRPEKELKGFERVMLAPVESREVTVPLPPRSFAYWDLRTNDWKVDEGRYTVRVGERSDALPLSGEVKVGKAMHLAVSE